MEAFPEATDRGQVNVVRAPGRPERRSCSARKATTV
jgi:hypothetical protein